MNMQEKESSICCRVHGDIPLSCSCVGGYSAEPRYQQNRSTHTTANTYSYNTVAFDFNTTLLYMPCLQFPVHLLLYFII